MASSRYRRLIAVLVVVLIGAVGSVVYFLAVEPALTKTFTAMNLDSGPDDNPSHYHWFVVLEERTTQRPLRNTKHDPYGVTLVIALLPKTAEPVAFSGGGSGDGTRYDLSLLTSRTEVGDEWKLEFETVYEHEINGSGDHEAVTLSDRRFELANGRMIVVDEAGQYHQCSFVSEVSTPGAVDGEVRLALNQFRKSR